MLNVLLVCSVCALSASAPGDSCQPEHLCPTKLSRIPTLYLHHGAAYMPHKSSQSSCNCCGVFEPRARSVLISNVAHFDGMICVENIFRKAVSEICKLFL